MKTLLSLLVLFFIAASSNSFADDWSQYRGEHGDGVSEESLGKIDWKSKAPKVLWKTPTPLGFSSFVIANERAFTIIARDGDGGAKVETCLALDANTGEELWAVPLGPSDYGHDGGNAGAPDNKGGDGPRSTPSTDGKHVFVYDANLVLSCLNAANGEIIWKHNIVEQFAGENIKWYNATSPLLVEDTIYVAGGGAGQTFLAFDKNTGKLIWKSGDETITHATPTFTTIHGERQVIFFVQSGLVAVKADSGKELWRSEFPFSVSTAASPVVEGNKVYCSAGYGVGAQLTEVASKGKAEQVWFKPNQLMNHWSTPLIHDGHLYGMFEFKKYGKAPLQCVELATGEIKWSERGFGPGNCILVDGKLIALSDSGEVVIVEAKTDAYSELGRMKAVTGKCWSTPAYSNGRLYVRSTEEAACLEIGKK